MKRLSSKVLYGAIGVFVLLLVWEILSLIISSTTLLPSPIEVMGAFFALIQKTAFLTALCSTALRALVGFIVAFTLGASLGALSYRFLPIRQALNPLTAVMKATPTMSIILLTVIWFTPKVSPAFIGFLIIFPLLYEGVYTALLGVDQKLIDMSKVYGVSKKDRILSLYLPSIRESIFSISRSTISLNVKVVIAGEVLAYTSKSLGMQMYIAKLDLATATLFGWTLWAILLSLLFEGLIMLIAHLTNPIRIRNRKRGKVVMGEK